MASFKCSGCDLYSLAYLEFKDSDARSVLKNDYEDVFISRGSELTWIPEHVVRIGFKDVPDVIADAAQEAYECLNTGRLRAAVMLARAVIEATAKEKGIADKGVSVKIDKMYEAQLIREYIKDGAHEVRHLANDMAHGDFVERVERADAELVLTLMNEVLQEVFQAPARVAAARDRRLERRAPDRGE